LHEGLEDGTLPFHNIIALGEAIDVHSELYGSMEKISAHTTALVRRMYLGMRGLRYGNGHPLCKIYEDEKAGTAYGDPVRQGATVAFNVFREDGGYEPYAAVERLANERGVYVRSGGKSNYLFTPQKGATANCSTQGFVVLEGCTTHCNTNLGSYIGLDPLDIIVVGSPLQAPILRSRSSGQLADSSGRPQRAELDKRAANRVRVLLSAVCRSLFDYFEHRSNILACRVVRASLGAMSTVQDVDRFLGFLHDTFIAREDSAYASSEGNVSAAADQFEHLDRDVVEACECVSPVAA
jgi:selenocysteine lyase/cysteine desulfurase